MTGTNNDEPRRRDRAMAVAALCLLAIGTAGGAIGAGVSAGLLDHPAPLVGAVLLVTVGAGVALAVRINRSAARKVGVPAKGLRPLARRIQRADIPADPQERAAMGRLITRQRQNTERMARYRWFYRAAAALFIMGAVFQFLNGSPLSALVALAAGALQLMQPHTLRRSLRRLDRASAALARRERATP
ncbi:hypothetical protein EDD93_2137 [Streptomyces sp. 840.1]|uniref:hypothetical protein n=1 Tax=Streptomyces sp. 840.1 TaxID=2485152 RepID=UPI000FBC9549|nr:hypothetical protein [Streptomyces sp. 840.1]ROQ67692.1 hypothetical protein EDD93_2137 [Streptomyces sp. 840.1]